MFGTHDVRLSSGTLHVRDRAYPVVDDVIVLLDPAQYPPALRSRIAAGHSSGTSKPEHFADDIQFTFGAEWESFPQILPEHRQEFDHYFDLTDTTALGGMRVCDLGCGIGRWSHFLQEKCRELVLVDFSEAIFVARKNLAGAHNALFFMGDLQVLPFRVDFADFLFCLGVLHHLPTNALDEVRALSRYSPLLLVYLYYALDNKPAAFRVLLAGVSALRGMLCRLRNPRLRSVLAWSAAIMIYKPLVVAGTVLRPVGLSRHVPLYEVYKGKSLRRIRQDAYDRFFTRIEQRFTRREIFGLCDTFSDVSVSESWPYWHFTCSR